MRSLSQTKRSRSAYPSHLLALESEAPMSHRHLSACMRTYGANPVRKLWSVLLAATLAFSLAPGTAWASTHDTVQPRETPAPTAQTAHASSVGALGDRAQGAGAGQAGQLEAPAATSGQAASDASSGGSPGMTSGTFSPVVGPSEASAAADQVAPPLNPGVPSPGHEPGELSVPSAHPADAAPRATGLSENTLLSVSALDYVVIQGTQDQGDADNVIGEINENDVLWANIYDFLSDDVIPHEASWTYQWMAAPSQSENEADYTPLAGATSQSLTITKALSRQLKGSYLAVEVIADGQNLIGPGSFGFEGDSTPGPVIAAPGVTGSLTIIGANAAGAEGAVQLWEPKTSITLDRDATAADLSEALFATKHVTADYGMGPYGWSLNTITSPLDAGLTLGWDAATGKYWQLFVNGTAASSGAGGVTIHEGDDVVWFYSSSHQTLPGTLSASAQIVGLDAEGNAQSWAAADDYAVVEGATAADLSEAMFATKGITASYGVGPYGWYLNTITSPSDPGRTLGWDAATGRFWQLFVNGSAAALGAGSTTLHQGDQVVWYYSADGQALPDSDGTIVVPDAPRPSYESSWPSFGSGAAGGAVVEAPTPTQAAQPSWAVPVRHQWGGTSDPLIVNGDIYMVAIDRLLKLDAATGTVKASRRLSGSVQYFCRPVYVDGLIVVPTDAATLAAYTADTLTCVWKTALPPLAGRQWQALSSLTVSNGCVYAGFTDPDNAGALMCVRVSDGTLAWSNVAETASGTPAGYYWAGATASGSDIVIGSDAGAVQLINGATGEVKSTLQLGGKVRTGVVAVPGEQNVYLAVTNDGVLHRFVRKGDALAAEGAVSFASGSTSTPTIYGGTAFIGGYDSSAPLGANGTLSMVDVASMTVKKTVGGLKGEVKSTPLVSVQGSDAYVYFTCNAAAGGVYSYRLGDDAAYTLFEPTDSSQRNYCSASIVADDFGNLYYTNDSGYMFALEGKPGALVTFNANGGSSVSASYVGLGMQVAKPADPTRSGYLFGGWCIDQACTRAWSFSDPVNGPLVLWAKWTPVGGGHGGGSKDEPVSPGQVIRTPLGGTVAAAHAPLASPASTDMVQPTDSSAGEKSSRQAEAFGSAPSEAAPPAADAGKEANPWAVGGIVIGCIGLAGAVAFRVVAGKRAMKAIGSAKGMRR